MKKRNWGLLPGCCLVAASVLPHMVPAPQANAQTTAQITATATPDQNSVPTGITGPRIDVKELGAKGDGKTNDNAAFERAAAEIEKAGGGTLVIPKGTYIVGEQFHEPGKYPYYQTKPIFHVKGVNGLLVEGNGATIRLAPGLHYGSFDKETGEVFNPKLPFTDYNYAVNAGIMIAVTKSRNVTIRNLELDGNCSTLILGGFFNDSGRQVLATGLYLHENSDVTVSKVHTHHHALDGLTIGWQTLKESDPATPCTLIDVNAEYNGRQGLSWVGGRGLKAMRCKFNHTGRALNDGRPLASAPGAGLDIEAEASVVRDGLFEDCEFIDNVGAGVAADSGDGGYTTFKRCTLWGTTSWGAWSRKPGLRYEDCKFYGSIVHAFASPDPKLATTWVRCKFEDKPWKNGLVYRRKSNAYLVEVNEAENVRFEDCEFTANQCKSIWFTAPADKPGFFTDCTWIHRKADAKDQDFMAVIRGAVVSGAHFKEDFPPNTNGRWFVNLSSTRVTADKPTTVDGPHVKWQNWSWGATGTVKPDIYNS